MTINEVIIVVTAFVTFVFGIITKKFGLVQSKYIPLQNLIIGIIAGVLVYFSGLNDSIISSIIICAASALTAGGAYDMKKVGEKE